MPFEKSTFEFSQSSRQWILARLNRCFQNPITHNLFKPISLDLWQMSKPGKELILFLKQYGLDYRFNGIDFFMSNLDTHYQGNPHIDLVERNHRYTVIKSRFNVLVLGNAQDPMFWWEHIDIDSDKLVETEFSLTPSTTYKSLAIVGSNIKERWNALGTPTAHSDNILTPSAFVKTSCAHTVNVSPGPRLIVSVGFNVDFEDLKTNLL